ncbi:hypothetical protein HDU90_008941 [Geranomyces variabilis]|nr:hypothetical protein HDU90_008941 [Geranomyces variabilis]
MVKLKPTVSGAITFTNENTIGESLTASSGIKRINNDFSLNLTSTNSGILVDNEAGSLTLDLTAGENITITNNKIAATIPEQQKYTAGPGLSMIGNEFINSLNITAGLGIIVAGSAETGYIISSESLKTEKNDDEDENTPDDTDETLKDVNPPETVETTSMIPVIFPPPLIAFPIVPVPPLIPAPIIMPLPTLLGGLAAAGGLFGTVFGYQREREKNSDGSYTLDSGGNYTWTDGSNVAIVN